MIRRPPRSTLDRSSAASDVYKRQEQHIASLALLDFPLAVVVREEHPYGGNKQDRPTAVSYTHLRAHETVLALVCRLLLANTTKTVNVAAVTILIPDYYAITYSTRSA